ncbi:MAG TPA: prolipoprotein diacylglyceryl transferase family protein, partial [Actinomycetota bacterium]|nr:prolipoprotein diacylglyceryl transferase family protein [Actinomycetota bacterium]
MNVAVIGWPVLDRIPLGPLSISPHGLGIAAGYLAGSWFMLREGRKRGLSEDHMGTILLWALVGAIFGARFFYVVAHFSEFESFTDMLAIWRGGISLLGGIAGAIAFAYPLMRRFGYRFLQVMDSAAIGLAFGIIIGRIGDLVIGDHLGKPTDFVLGWAYRGGELPGPWQYVPILDQWQAPLSGGLVQTISREGAQLIDGTRVIAEGPGVHQTALYDFFIALGLFLFLLWLNRRPRPEGALIMTFALWYGAGRVLTDFLRVDKEFFGLTGSQWGAILAMVLAAVGLLRLGGGARGARAAGA